MLTSGLSPVCSKSHVFELFLDGTATVKSVTNSAPSSVNLGYKKNITFSFSRLSIVILNKIQIITLLS